MQKDFLRWHKKKSRLNDVPNGPLFHEREVWLCYFGANIGSEQDGKGDAFLRPAVILQKFGRGVFWALLLTRVPKMDQYHFPLSFKPDVKSFAILSQIRLFDMRRLKRKIGNVEEVDFELMKQKFKALLP